MTKNELEYIYTTELCLGLIGCASSALPSMVQFVFSPSQISSSKVNCDNLERVPFTALIHKFFQRIPPAIANISLAIAIQITARI